MPDLIVEFIDSSADVAPLWQELETRLGNESISCSWDWTSCWLKHYGDLIPHFFAVGKRDGRVCSLALVVRHIVRRGPFRIKTVSLGTTGEPDADSVCLEYNQFLSAPEDRYHFAEALLSRLERDADWDAFSLDGFDEESAAPFFRAETRFDKEVRVSNLFDYSLVGPSSSVLESIGKSARKKVEYSIKRMGVLLPESAGSLNEAMDIFKELVDLHQKRWTSVGKPGSFASARFKSFHEDIIRGLFSKQSILMFRLKCDGKTIGCLYGFVEGKKARFYQSGVASFGDNKIAVGYVAHTLCMEACRLAGMTEYDFLIGDTHYKQLFANRQRNLLWATFHRSRAKYHVLNRLKGLKKLISPVKERTA